MLNLFPMPSPPGLALDPTGNRGYNFRAVLPQLRPLDDKILRVDYNFSPKVQIFVRLLQDYQAQNGYNVTVGPPGGAWGQFPASYHVQSAGALATLIYTISPTLINEFSWGINRGLQGVESADRHQRRSYHRRRQDLRAEPAAAEGRQRQCAYPAAHQPGQQLLEPAAGGQLRPALAASRASPPARCYRRPHFQPGQPLALHRHRPVADHPGQHDLGEGLAHVQRPASISRRWLAT